MAGWVAKEQSGKEVIFRHKPHRVPWFDNKSGKWSDEKTYWIDDHNFRGTGHLGYSQRESRIILPKGSIEKLTGSKMSWNDEPRKIR